DRLDPERTTTPETNKKIYTTLPSTVIPCLSTSHLPSSNNDRPDPERIVIPEKRPLSRDLTRPWTSEAIRRVHEIPLVQEQSTKLPSGLIVASAEHRHQADKAHLILMYRAGTRYETVNEIGLVRLIMAIISYNQRKMLSNPRRFPAELDMTFSVTPDYLGVILTVPRRKSHLALEYASHLAALKDCNLDVFPQQGDLDGPVPPPNLLAAEFVRKAAYG
ncbi:hypothetical protein PMAYCL1PPCAC_20443, partial [Pristionchus mayeri]